jgi:hypothetical protein
MDNRTPAKAHSTYIETITIDYRILTERYHTRRPSMIQGERTIARNGSAVENLEFGISGGNIPNRVINIHKKPVETIETCNRRVARQSHIRTPREIITISQRVPSRHSIRRILIVQAHQLAGLLEERTIRRVGHDHRESESAGR